MTSRAIHICVTSIGLDELKRKQQRDPIAVARMIADAGRFSVFESTANPVIAKTVTWLMESGWFELDNKKHGYPWTAAKLTEAGRQALERGEVDAQDAGTKSGRRSGDSHARRRKPRSP